MNEKIKELAMQSKLLDEDGWNTTNLTLTTETFAELIITSCLDEIETYCVPVGNSPAGEIAQEWTISALTEISDNIKEKFGLK